MKKFILSTLLLASSLWAFAQNKEVTEIAVYRISGNHNENFENLLKDFRSHVSKLAGFKTYTTLQDIRGPNIYIDILPWSDINTALAAADNVKNGKKYIPYIAAIDSLIAHGEFYPYQVFIHNKTKIPMQSKITEVVIYQIKTDKVDNYETITENVDLFLKSQKGFISRIIMQDHKDKTVFMDIVEWESIEDAENALQKSQQEKALLPFFEATEKVITFSHYSFFR